MGVTKSFTGFTGASERRELMTRFAGGAMSNPPPSRRSTHQFTGADESVKQAPLVIVRIAGEKFVILIGADKVRFHRHNASAA